MQFLFQRSVTSLVFEASQKLNVECYGSKYTKLINSTKKNIRQLPLLEACLPKCIRHFPLTALSFSKNYFISFGNKTDSKQIRIGWLENELSDVIGKENKRTKINTEPETSARKHKSTVGLIDEFCNRINVGRVKKRTKLIERIRIKRSLLRTNVHQASSISCLNGIRGKSTLPFEQGNSRSSLGN